MGTDPGDVRAAVVQVLRDDGRTLQANSDITVVAIHETQDLVAAAVLRRPSNYDPEEFASLPVEKYSILDTVVLDQRNGFDVLALSSDVHEGSVLECLNSTSARYPIEGVSSMQFAVGRMGPTVAVDVVRLDSRWTHVGHGEATYPVSRFGWCVVIRERSVDRFTL